DDDQLVSDWQNGMNGRNNSGVTHLHVPPHSPAQFPINSTQLTEESPLLRSIDDGNDATGRESTFVGFVDF
ncbi:hypothetical protein PFISCL1PPCAC_18705, partial [Pristionchus fissidentatus]